MIDKLAQFKGLSLSPRIAHRALSLCVALSMLLVAVAPQVYVWLKQGRAWNGALVYFTSDERAYEAYVNALIDGRPRRNDPYTGRDEELDAARVESLFSIQFVPAYALAYAARLFHLSTSAVFFALLCGSAVAAALVIFQLIFALTGDARLAAAGTLFVLCLGTLASGYGIWDHTHLDPGIRFRHLPFLRRYQPAFPFAFFFGFCALVRRSLAHKDERRGAAYATATLAGLCFVMLVYSYFFLWTAAAAWLVTLALVWLLARPTERRAALKRLGIIVAAATIALVPYASLLARRGATTDAAEALVRSHTPDLFRVPEAFGFALLFLLCWAWRRGRFAGDDAAALFALSFVLLPFVVFNQQIITGRTLQPMHYDAFIVNYCVLLAVVLCVALVRARPFATRFLACVALAALAWASFETTVWTRKDGAYLLFQDEAHAPSTLLARLGRESASGGPDTHSIVFSPIVPVSDSLPASAPQPVLWAPHTFVFAGASAEEEHERLLQYLYYSGIDLSAADTRAYETLDATGKYYLYSLLGAARANPQLAPHWQPVTAEEMRRAFKEVSDYAATFDRARAARFPVSYLLVYDTAVELPNFDRWYERDAGQHAGHFMLYRVRLRT
ncbi:MAG: hypothetical protein QOE33_1287 [Acidobacteriota bacterium]|nr:hypothetical protein [Acidobacteriota bacterium]